MEGLNRDGTITIGGISFDFPCDPPRWEVCRTKLGERTRSIAVDAFAYEREVTKDTDGVAMERHALSLTNHGKCFLDGKPLSGDDTRKTRDLFAELKLTP